MTYKEQLLDPRWQKRRLEIFERDHWMCRSCCETSKTLHVHHMVYEKNCTAWNADDLCLVTVCSDCHEKLHSKNENERVQEFIYLWFNIWLKEQFNAKN